MLLFIFQAVSSTSFVTSLGEVKTANLYYYKVCIIILKIQILK